MFKSFYVFFVFFVYGLTCVGTFGIVLNKYRSIRFVGVIISLDFLLKDLSLGFLRGAVYFNECPG